MNRIAFLTAFIEKDPTDLFSRHALALELIKQGNDDEARLVMEGILLIDEQYVGTYYHLGKLLERTGALSMARDVYVKGSVVAARLGEHNSLRELKAALQQVNDELGS